MAGPAAACSAPFAHFLDMSDHAAVRFKALAEGYSGHIRFAVEPFGINQDIPAPAKLPMQASYACFVNMIGNYLWIIGLLGGASGAAGVIANVTHAV